ncbi:hypothetical protein HY030_01450 [Candidatus Gottesmanbacteria bacterium]|nr:hypothetical protein [Candidatus Gottesmanbacteria bacterium]
MKINLEDLRKFLISSNKAGYATGEEKAWIKEKDRSTTINYKKNKWKSHDNFFGGEPYGGRTVVFYENKPVWIMVYYGLVEKTISDPETIYKVLRNALRLMPKDYPFRGLARYKEAEYLYVNKWFGNLENFSGKEIIKIGKRVVYKANYMGGLVDQRFRV